MGVAPTARSPVFRARVFRISFTGECAFEINVPVVLRPGALAEPIMTAGAKYDITPYGTEAMHVLRAEKGYIIVGQETDGSVTPLDLSMDWIVSKTEGLHRQAFAQPRSDMAKPDRKQLVGLLTEDPEDGLCRRGPSWSSKCYLDKPPMPMVGHVSSSYYSPNLGHSIALGLVKGGLSRHGETLFAPLAGGKVITCRICDPVFFDPEGERLRG